MAPGLNQRSCGAQEFDQPREPRPKNILAVFGIAIFFVLATRWPVARPSPFESDEHGFLGQMASHWFPMHHTLFLLFARIFGSLANTPYRGLILLDMLTSAGALVSTWWYLRAVARPATAAAGAVMLGVAPIFWGYGAMAGNYTAIILVGSFLLGVAYRGADHVNPWQPLASAIVFAIGTGYRQDIGTLWLPVFAVILWQHRWKRGIAGALVFTALNLGWLLPMLYEVGGWSQYRAASAEFAHQAGYLNSVWSLGFVDAPARYAVKLGMALVWTLGPALLFVPRGMWRLTQLGLTQNEGTGTFPDASRRAEETCAETAHCGNQIKHPRLLAFLLAISVLPALASHLLVHFGVPGYCFHYVPALILLAILGAGRAGSIELDQRSFIRASFEWAFGSAPIRLAGIAAVLAAMFWFYPTDYNHRGFRGSFDLAFCRFTRMGLQTPMPDRSPAYWRTANSRGVADTRNRRPAEPRADEG